MPPAHDRAFPQVRNSHRAWDKRVLPRLGKYKLRRITPP
jgi:hypothetical protein